MKCCLIGCGAAADFMILARRQEGPAGPDPYGDDTLACELHVGALLGCQPNAPRPAEIFWEVRQLAGRRAKAAVPPTLPFRRA
jgi:hypothetical protein